MRDEIVKIYGPTTDTELLLFAIDAMVATLIGPDDTEETEMPVHWNDSLKKQYINFRNHLRRAMRAKYGDKR